MIHTQATKLVQMIRPQAIVDNASYTTVELDTLGWEHCTVVVQLGAIDATMTALKMQESAAAGSGQADITGLIFGTSANDTGSTSALPVDADDNKVYVFDIDLKARQRYLTLVAAGGNGALGMYASALAILSRGHKTPVSATERGAAQVLRV